MGIVEVKQRMFMKYLLLLLLITPVLAEEDTWKDHLLLPNQKKYEVPIKENYIGRIIEIEAGETICYYSYVKYHDPSGFWYDQDKHANFYCAPKPICKDLNTEHQRHENKDRQKEQR